MAAAQSSNLDLDVPDRHIDLDDAEETPIAVPVELRTDTDSWLTWARSFVVTDAESYTTCVESIAKAKTLAKRWEDLLRPGVKRLYDRYVKRRDELTAETAPLEQLEKTLKGKAVAWYQADQKRIRDEEAELRRVAQLAVETQRVNTAAALEAEGNKIGGDAGRNLVETANRIINQPVPTPAIMPVASAAPKTAGVGHSSKKRCRLDANDPKAFEKMVKYIAEHPEWLHLLRVADDSTLDRTAKDFYNRCPVPGVVFFEEGGMSVSADRVPQRGR